MNSAAKHPDELIADALEQWRSALVALAGDSSLADITLLGEAALELTSCHPSGLAQLYAERSTKLSSLFREVDTLPQARRRAREVRQKSQEQTERLGVTPTYLAVGIATWTEDLNDFQEDYVDVAALVRATANTGGNAASQSEAKGGGSADNLRGNLRKVRAPILLRPIVIDEIFNDRNDFDLTLERAAELNPVLTRALKARRALIDPVALAESALTQNGFQPANVLHRIKELGSALLRDFVITESIVVGTFVHPGQILIEDLDALAPDMRNHEVIAALAGNEQAKAKILGKESSKAKKLKEAVAKETKPNQENGVGDLDVSQQFALELIRSGRHLFVDTPTGSQATKLVAAIVANAAAKEQSILYIPGHRRAVDNLTLVLRDLGLSDLIIDMGKAVRNPGEVSRRLLSAMSLEPVVADVEEVSEKRHQLQDVRQKLTETISALHQERSPWNVSAYQTMQEMARLTNRDDAPANKSRLSKECAVNIARFGRPQVAKELRRAAELGAFTITAESTPWFGANIETAEVAAGVTSSLNVLVEEYLPAIVEQRKIVVESTGLKDTENLAEWVAQLAMLDSIRVTEDIFDMSIFEKVTDELVQAAASRSWRRDHGIEMSFWHRRRLIKYAKDSLRANKSNIDLFEKLQNAKAQRDQWEHHCPGKHLPHLPEGLAYFKVLCDAAETEVQYLNQVLETTPAGGDLLNASWDDLTARLKELNGDLSALTTLPSRTRVLKELARIGLSDFIAECQNRQIDTDQIEAELELSWWASVFNLIFEEDPQLVELNHTMLDDLVADFKTLDRYQIKSLAAPLRAEYIKQMRERLLEDSTTSGELFEELRYERVNNLRLASERFGQLVYHLRPCMVASPTLIPHMVRPSRSIDLVIFDSAEHLPLEAVISAIARGKQIVVLADKKVSSGSAVHNLSELLPNVSLSAHSWRRETELVKFLKNHGYADQIKELPLPEPTKYIGFEVVAGRGVVVERSNAISSTQEEVERVVELVTDHALRTPSASLAIIAGNRFHAERIRAALDGAMRRNRALSDFVEKRRREPVVIVEINSIACLQRDAVILTLGFGRTAHDRVLHRFGGISEQNGHALLLGALGVHRNRLTLVSCFDFQMLDLKLLKQPGPQLLAEVLNFAAGEKSVPLGRFSQLANQNTSGVDAGVGVGSESGTGAVAEAGVEINADYSVETSTEAQSSDSAVELGAQTLAKSSRDDFLLQDLAERLENEGLSVEFDYGQDLDFKIPLVVSEYGKQGPWGVAVLIDNDWYLNQQSLRYRDRQLPELLSKLGWNVVQLWSVSLFCEPDVQVQKIKTALFGEPVSLSEQVLNHEVEEQDLAQETEHSAEDVSEGVSEGDVVWGATGIVELESDGDVATEDAEAGNGAGIESAAVAVSDWQDDAEKPVFKTGLDPAAYSAGLIEGLVAWIQSQGEFSTSETIELVRHELQVTKRSRSFDNLIKQGVQKLNKRRSA